MTCVSGLCQVRRGGQNSDIMHNTRVPLNRVCLQGLHARFIVVTSSSIFPRVPPASAHTILSRTPTDMSRQVRSETGRNTLIIKLRYEDTIADLRRYIDDHRCVSRSRVARVCAGQPLQYALAGLWTALTRFERRLRPVPMTTCP